MLLSVVKSLIRAFLRQGWSEANLLLCVTDMHNYLSVNIALLLGVHTSQYFFFF